MSLVLSSTSLLLVSLSCIALFFVIAGASYGKKLITVWAKPLAQAKSTMYASSTRHLSAQEQLLPPLIDKPGASTDLEGFFEDDETAFDAMDDADTVLLKEAERVVEEIQDVVNHIASHPANPDEVFTKIRAIVSQYGFFRETEYYDAINNFVAITVQRDCDLELTQDDLKTLWHAEAA